MMSERRANEFGMSGYLNRADMEADNATINEVTDLISVSVNGGKYTIQQTGPGTWEALRYGEEWPAFRDSGPDNLHVALAYEVARLRGVRDDLLHSLKELDAKCDLFPSADYHIRARAAIDKAEAGL